MVLLLLKFNQKQECIIFNFPKRKCHLCYWNNCISTTLWLSFKCFGHEKIGSIGFGGWRYREGWTKFFTEWLLLVSACCPYLLVCWLQLGGGTSMHLITGLFRNQLFSLAPNDHKYFVLLPSLSPFLPHNSANKQPLKQSQLCKKQKKYHENCHALLQISGSCARFLMCQHPFCLSLNIKISLKSGAQNRL